MPSVAEQLHEAREARRLTIEQVAQITKVRSDHVRAIEKGDYSVFSAPVYIRGFVRSYAGLLKLEVPKVMADLDAELGKTSQFAAPPPLTEHSRGFIDLVMLQFSKLDPRRTLPILGALVILGVLFLGVVAYRKYRSTDPLKGLKPGVYQPSGKSQAETLPLPPKH